ncbi:MAG: protein-disulfide reductase DsbD [Gammaproteobacteria bacterium]|nr:protein-disulfide reductase DsbD [Gammaproteobacteria bacterium]
MSNSPISWAKTVIILCLTFASHSVWASDPFSSINSMGGGFGGGAEEILEPDQAFILSTSSAAGQVIANWEIAEGHYLYRDKIKIIADDNKISTGELQVSKGELKHDEYFGDIYVFHHQAQAILPITAIGNGAESVNFKVKYQGCSEISGICYPPITKDIKLKLSPVSSAAAAQTESKPQPPVSEQDQIAESLKSGSSWFIILSFFGFGLLLAFTPCVFPMIPILSGIIIGQGDKISTRSAFTLSVIYVLAMAVTYTVAGIAAGVFGENIQAAFQNPWILGSFAAVFVLLSLSMFGFYELQMPSAIQSRLTEYSNKQQGGTYAGVAIMGFLSALIVGPCVAAPLAGALIYIGQTGDAVLGGLALFALSMGMGAPLIAIGTSAGKLLPRAGGWMDAIKAVFGVMLLGVAIWMLERIIPATVGMLLWAILFIVSSIYMGALEGLKAESNGWNRLWKGLGLILFAYGMLLLIGASAGGKDMMQPLKGLAMASGQSAQSQPHLQFKQIKGLAGLNQQLAMAEQQNKTVMLDFYADWCISCKEMEKYTFTDPVVQSELKNTLLLQADVTANDAQDKELYKHFGIIGPPAIIFYNTQGKEQKNYRVVGYMPADKFGPHVQQALN